ncbi:uncharacterized protein LOC131314007 [Rhododendron vialii]|uniref:uncharacterized protein LOC131314007 n=1 Tax=Rhododendron vialii TaxID=182163 RepID=UPI00265FA321|nr:uncharacterized protein LOC131314007 [Rhododendron vialii]
MLVADTLWIKWVHTYIIKDQCLWAMEVPCDASWTMRKLLGLRRLGQSLIKYQIGNGERTFLWWDNWHPLGLLYDRFGDRVVHNVGRSLRAKVASIVENGAWRWPRLRNHLIQTIVSHTQNLVPHPEMVDSVIWVPHPSGIFTIKSAWEAIREKFPIQPRFKVIWGSHNVPRWSFILWLAALHRLSTKDRLRNWGMALDALCCLCQDEEESHHHLFFDCSYSTRGNVSWDTFRFVSLKSTLTATVYGLWQERNSRIFCAKMKDHTQVATDIANGIRAFLSSRRNVKQSLQNRSICEIWGLPHRIMQSV